MSRVGRFIAFLERLQREHCRPEGQPSPCHHDATRCPIAKALSHDYADFLWCAWCNSFKFPGERKDKIKMKGESELSETKIITRWLLGGQGGLIRGFLPTQWIHLYKVVLACKCEVGKRARINGKKVVSYDFAADPESQNDCFQKRLLDLIKRDAELARQGQRSE